MHLVSRARRSRLVWLGVAAAAVAVAAVTVPLTVTASNATSPPSARDQRWRRDIAYLASELPAVRVDGLGAVTVANWRAAAARLEALVPQLTDGQLLVGLARMVAMLHDDETQVLFPSGPVYSLDAQWFGPSLYLLGAPTADRDLVGGQLLAVDGHPIAQVMTRIAAVIDYQDGGILRVTQAGYLDDASVLYWLGITSSPASAEFTVRTRAGGTVTAGIPAGGTGTIVDATPELLSLLPGMAHGPLPLYQQDMSTPYWLRVLPGQDAVYLRYNQCVVSPGFTQLVARALAELQQHPAYRLIVDLRDNLGGSSVPFQALVSGIAKDPAINRRGGVFGLVDQFTDSAATVDLYQLRQQTRALLIGVPPADPIDEFGDESTLTLPDSDITVQYTTALVNTGGPMGTPDVTVAPTISQVLAGQDPVLARALSYPRAAG